MGIGTSLVVGAVVSSIVCGVQWAKHKPVKKATNANAYVDKSTIELTVKRDNFVNHEITKTAVN